MNPIYKKYKTVFWFFGAIVVVGLLPQIVTALIPAQASYWQHIFIIVLLYVILATGLNMLTGVTGLLSIGHAAFYGLGAYTSALLGLHFQLPFVVTFLMAGVVAGVMGLLLSLPSLKLRDTYLTIVTIGFGQIVYTILNEWRELTKGPMGLSHIPAPSFFGYTLDTRIKYFYLLLVMTALFVLVAYQLERSLVGRAMKSVRDDQLAAEVVGVNTKYYKMFSFTLSAVFAGCAGSLYAHYLGYISPDTFGANFSTSMLMMVIIGGLGSIPGSIIGAVVVALLPEILRQFSQWQLVIYGVLLIIFMIFLPKGLVQLFKDLLNKIFGTKNKKSLTKEDR